MNLAALNLNLLVAFDALLAQASVGRVQVDPNSIWLRGLVLEIGRGLDRAKRQAA